MPCPHLAHDSEEALNVIQQSALLVPTEDPPFCGICKDSQRATFDTGKTDPGGR